MKDQRTENNWSQSKLEKLLFLVKIAVWKTSRLESLQMKEILISICEIVVLYVFHKYAQQMQVHTEQQSKEEDNIQKSILWMHLGFWSLGVDAVYMLNIVLREWIYEIWVFFLLEK